jgi:hypothetical protein
MRIIELEEFSVNSTTHHANTSHVSRYTVNRAPGHGADLDKETVLLEFLEPKKSENPEEPSRV